MDDLLTKNMKIIQSDEVFCFSMDAVLLARFAGIPPKGRIVDLCTGNGVIPLLLSTRTAAHIDAVEIQDRLYDMASRNIRLNKLHEQITVYHGDVKEAVSFLGNGKYDFLTCNPPYMPVVGGDKNKSSHVAIARHEILLTLEEMIQVSCRLVRSGGKVAYVHRAGRLADIISIMRAYRIEPKRVRFVHPRAGADANMLLIEGIRDGKPDMKILPPLIVYGEDGQYCEEIYSIYYGNKTED
ncbi:tRNA1(Val) (adenine(37)-N6)-methyltransferase [Aneurinibacillus sp. Ricciae_BoGa-3]|uniref:tRNA1(Val) (adenine(37)-N6)-methyltransferase n=1 Tax=Aneurinibacillus sp. Ricciae_BoGa-3 TaxID=3022697 RepID=UPI0023427783|nr:tRNA1(Val) (adenine(37)-N6)-methyltransferase [Aneurinibacillus sp. Ricciae_BoGa-3]WCK56687.1 tRNA1(Val) (adenine(37)-N6)-methyltransferase [Aneurinibacillus sp. Ricciae_BoGa-3]